jgi:hypothetical protein
MRQEWLNHGCNKSQIQDAKGCSTLDYSTTSESPLTNADSISAKKKEQTQYSLREDTKKSVRTEEVKQNTGLLTSICVILGLIFVVGVFLIYAYLNPLSSSGQFLIKYRPWAWHRRGEARYTAASSLHT